MDAIYQLLGLSVLIVPLVILFYILNVVRKIDKRAEERLKLDRENATFQQQQTQELTELKKRLTNIENVLKEVD